eukprot:gnl/MRDRNA2_/MRDRNA2_76128_c0_seq1.p1 gnl/MRDRNA2_/MRDRNA2_76128_c0~~gnl/MRDRNA2_/MRDRNA2_76128_c0_seq1.p1  ORF type:complete len:871 (-),score=176.97 gnl/MRDRNA2_/MRDRNA2_76128_c0_seq1:523-3135(-)
MHTVGRQTGNAPKSRGHDRGSNHIRPEKPPRDKKPSGKWVDESAMMKPAMMKSAMMSNVKSCQNQSEFAERSLNQVKEMNNRNTQPSKDGGNSRPASASPCLAGDLFQLLDANADGHIDPLEYKLFHNAITEELPDSPMISNDPIHSEFNDVDKDHDGEIDHEEWDRYICAMIEVLGKQRWKDAAVRVAAKLNDSVMRKVLCAPGPAPPQLMEQSSNLLYCVETLGSNWLLPDANKEVAFSPKEVELLKKYFRMRDTNDSGHLSTDELMQVMDDLGRMPQPHTVQHTDFMALRSLVDKDNDGCLAFDEFLAFLQAYYQETYRKIFAIYDKDGNGCMSWHELGSLLLSLRQHGFDIPEGHINELINHVDTNDDGHLDFHEFCHLMQKYREIEFDYLRSFAGYDSQSVQDIYQIFGTMASSHQIEGAERLAAREVATLLDKMQGGESLQTRTDLHAFGLLFSRTDLDQSATLDFEEFLRLLRVWCKGGHRQSHEDASDYSHGFRWRPFGEEKEAILDGWAEEFEHDIRDAAISQKHEIDLSQVRALRDCFEFVDLNGSGKLQQVELEFFLETIGYPKEAGAHAQAFKEASQVHDLAEGLDLQGAVDFMCAYQKGITHSILGRAKKPIAREKILSSLYAMGRYLAPDAVESLLVDAGVTSNVISEEDFGKVMQLLRSRSLIRWSERCGFDEDEVQNWQGAFDAALKEEAGPNAEYQTEITVDRAIVLLRELNRLENDDQQKDMLFRAVSRVDRDNSGALSFTEFLYLLRHLLNLRTYKMTQANEEAIDAQKLSPEAAEQLLNLFNRADTNHDGLLESEKIVGVFKELGIANTDRKIQRLKNYIFKVANSDSPISPLTFPQFLQVLHEIDSMGL